MARLSVPPSLRMELVPIARDLPADFEALRADAVQEGFDHIERLAVDWVDGTMRFTEPGEVLLGAKCEGTLAAIGGLTLQPEMAETLRLRRFYVRPMFRRAQIGRTIAFHLIAHARNLNCDLTLRARTEQARAFWERLGFLPHQGLDFTHRMILRDRVPE